MDARKAFIIAANLLIALVVFQSHTRFFKDMILSGSEKKTTPRLGPHSELISGKFQTEVESWLKQNIGFRGTFVKTDNQINFSIFREFSRSHPRQLILGKNKYLYEPLYVDTYNGLNRTSDHGLEKMAASLKRLQDLLLRRNIRFLLVISPSKATVYPEYLPDRFTLKRECVGPDDYQRMVPLLKRHGINVVDSRAFFLEEKARGTTHLFPTSGTHWSLYGACLFTVKVLERMEQILGRPIVRYSIRRVLSSREPRELDKDIARLANILFTRSLFTDYLYPETVPIEPPGAYRPDMIIVGTSCTWNMIAYLDPNRTFSRLDFYYYFNTRYRYPGLIPGRVDRKAVDWERDIFSRDIIIMETNEIAIGEDMFDFVGPAITALEGR